MTDILVQVAAKNTKNAKCLTNVQIATKFIATTTTAAKTAARVAAVTALPLCNGILLSTNGANFITQLKQTA